MSQDRIYAQPLRSVGDFVFDQDVVDVFPDMIARSVPGYASILAMTVELAGEYARSNSCVYDLGCSLGAVTLPMAGRIPDGCKIIAVDSSPAMVSQLRENLAAADVRSDRVELREQDIAECEVRNASYVVMNFTLQFIMPDQRADLIARLYDGMLPGGALVLSEKIHFESPEQQSLMTDLHHAFKRANGYSDLEIAQKRTALENIMKPESLSQHCDRLHAAGFGNVSVWFQCLNFASIIAIK